MKTRITTKPKRCLKFEGYIYIPNDKADFNELRYYVAHRVGRLIIYDEFGKPITKKSIAFDNLGQVINKIELMFKKLVQKRVKRQKW